MKAISIDLILTSVSTRADSSLGLRFATPELQAEEKTALFQLQNQQLKVIIQPTSEVAESLIEVKNKLGFRTPGQRLRAVLFLEWKAKNTDGSFEEFYHKTMDGIIEHRKANLNPE